jgi:hypothetical protein
MHWITNKHKEKKETSPNRYVRLVDTGVQRRSNGREEVRKIYQGWGEEGYLSTACVSKSGP